MQLETTKSFYWNDGGLNFVISYDTANAKGQELDFVLSASPERFIKWNRDFFDSTAWTLDRLASLSQPEIDEVLAELNENSTWTVLNVSLEA